ncbi:MAG: RloB family protein [Marinoscillum sp.]
MKMKNKKAVQEAARKERKQQLLEDKARRRGEPNLSRREPEKMPNPTILIVCEGKNTEPSYFRQFRLTSATIKSVGEGYNTVSLVNRAIQISQEKEYDQVWCVFDKDDFDANDFNNAIVMAEANGFGVAYSNQAFEYWFILHFEDHQGAGMHRKDYDQKINQHLNPFGVTYHGNGDKLVNTEMFELLDGIDDQTQIERKQLAITRARRNFDRLEHHSPANEESSTTVFKLVEELLKYI